MKNKFLAAALLMFLPLVACSNNSNTQNPSSGEQGQGEGQGGQGEGQGGEGQGGGETYQVGEVEAQVISFLQGRGVEVEQIPLLNLLTVNDLTYLDYELQPYTYEGEQYVAYFSFAIEGDQTSSILETLTDLGWDVPAAESAYGYECVDSTKKIEVDVLYDAESYYMQDGTTIPASTYLTVYAYEDIAGDDPIGGGGEEEGSVEEAIIAFLASRDITLTSFDYLNFISEDALYDTDISDGTDGYYPCYGLIYEGDFVDAILANFRNDNWKVPSKAGDYGYECVDADQLIEVDVDYYQGFTTVYVYSYADLYGDDPIGGGGELNVDEGVAGTYTITASDLGQTEAGQFTATAFGLVIECSDGIINSDQIRFYAGSTFYFYIIGFEITNIEFNCTANGTEKYGPGNATANKGEYTYEGSKGTWSGSSSSVGFSTTKQLRLTSIVVTYVEVAE